MKTTSFARWLLVGALLAPATVPLHAEDVGDATGTTVENAPAATTADTISNDSEPAASVRDTGPMLEAVDIPTADILDPKTFSTAFRFYSQGGITSRIVLGPFRRLNVGFSLDSQRLIGGEDPHLVKPAVFFKLKAFDGTDYLPALSLGYDNQGYLYKDSLRDFSQQERGLYFVGSHEIFIPDFELHAGMNFPRIDESGNPYGFVGATWKFIPAFALLAEYDNIRNGYDNRFNLGGRLWVTSFFNVDLAARNVGRGSGRGAERIVRINYVANFPF